MEYLHEILPLRAQGTYWKMRQKECKNQSEHRALGKQSPLNQLSKPHILVPRDWRRRREHAWVYTRLSAYVLQFCGPLDCVNKRVSDYCVLFGSLSLLLSCLVLLDVIVLIYLVIFFCTVWLLSLRILFFFTERQKNSGSGGEGKREGTRKSRGKVN